MSEDHDPAAYIGVREWVNRPRTYTVPKKLWVTEHVDYRIRLHSTASECEELHVCVETFRSVCGNAFPILAWCHAKRQVAVESYARCPVLAISASQMNLSEGHYAGATTY